MNKVLRFLSYVLVAAVAAAAALALTAPGLSYQKDSSKLEELAGIIDYYFIGEPDMAAVEDAAAAAMVDAIGDRWSYYMTAQEYATYLEQMKNAYVGIGVSVSQQESGYVDVLKVEQGSPAQAAGMLPGDVIIAVEGQDISGWPMGEVQSAIKGKEGTQVQVTVRRSSGDKVLTITRQQIKTVVAKGSMLTRNVGYIQIVNFDSRCADETLGLLKELLDQGAEGIIFDVRYNPGGYKDELVKILNYLLPEGPLFRSVDYAGKELVDTSDANCLEVPMAVLINGDSYSAAEFFAAALREYDAAVLVGEPTTGKGHFQTSFELSDGSAAVISIGKYTTPKGVSLADVGLTPDVLVEVEDELYAQISYGYVMPMDDPQVKAALDALKMG